MPLFFISYISRCAAASGSGELHRFVDITDGQSYRLAELIMKIVNRILGVFGLEHHEALVTVLYALVVLGVSIVAGYVAQWVIFAILRQVAKRWDGGVYQTLRGVGFFKKLCRVIPALVFLILIQFTLSAHNVLSNVLTKITLIYVVLVTAIAVSALIIAVWQHVDER